MNDHGNLQILCICDDDAIRFSREPVLREAGYESKWLPSNADLDAVSVRGFNIAIICQTVSWKRAAYLTALFKRLNPAIRVLRVNTLRSEMDNALKFECELVSGMGALIQILDSLSKKQIESYTVSQRHRWAFNPS
jgi:hypothetical protein